MTEGVYRISTSEVIDSANSPTEITPGYISNEPLNDNAALEPFWRALRENEYSWQGRFFIAAGESFQAKLEVLDEKRSRIATGFGIIAVGNVMELQGSVQPIAGGGYVETTKVLVPDDYEFQLPEFKFSSSVNSPIAQAFYDESGKAIRCVLENGDIYIDEGYGGLWKQYDGHSDTYFWSPDDPTGYRV